MKKLILIFALILPLFFSAQTARDINVIIQKTVDLHALKAYFNDDEKAGETPIIIINDDKIPNNLIVFKFNKRVKVMTFGEIETFKNMSEKTGIPYQSLINLYLRDCVAQHREVDITWRKQA